MKGKEKTKERGYEKKVGENEVEKKKKGKKRGRYNFCNHNFLTGIQGEKEVLFSLLNFFAYIH